MMKAGHCNYDGEFKWEVLSRSELSKIAPDGVWKVKSGVETAVGGTAMDNVWKPGGLKQVNFPLFTDTDPNDLEQAADIAYRFGSSVYSKDIWVDYNGSLRTIEIKRMSTMELEEHEERKKEREGKENEDLTGEEK